MKKLKNNKMLLGIGITFLLLATLSLSYAWFSATVKTENEHDQIVTTGTLELTYIDGPEIKIEKARPGQTLTKEVRVKNTGSLDAYYNLVWQELTNGITNDELVISIACKSLDKDGNPGEACEELEETPVSGNILLENVSIESNVTHIFTITVTFKELNKDQNYNQGKNFSGVLGVNEYKESTTPKPVYCTYDGDLVQGATFTKGIYTYKYKQKSYWGLFENTDEDGWGVTLTDKDSTDPVTEAPCTSINNNPLIFVGFMFYNSKAKSIDISSYDTSKLNDISYMFSGTSASSINLNGFKTETITNMKGLFYGSDATEIKGYENIDTSNVTDLSYMFAYINLSQIDVSNYNTSNVTTMGSMFDATAATELIGLENFDTSNVTDMSGMFSGSKIEKLDVSNFNTSKVTNMNGIFGGSEATEIIGYENFDTSKVTNMRGMFSQVKIPVLDISKYDTSNVTDMYALFRFIKGNVEIKGLDKIDTSNVTNMSEMFYQNKTANIDLSNFNTSKVTNMSKMFKESAVTSLDLSSFDTSNVTNMKEMFLDAINLTTIYVTNKFKTDNVTLYGSMFNGCSKLVGGNGTKYNKIYSYDKTYARVDGGPDSDTPGYFTLKQ